MKMPSVFPVASHTDNVGPDSTFVVIKGLNFDGVKYIDAAIAKGATTIIVQKDVELKKEYDAHIIRVDDTRIALAELSAQAAGYPSQKLNLLGITGTKGKTTSAYLLNHVLQKAGYKTALLSTIKNSIAGHDIPATMTTAQPDYLHQFFKLCVQKDVEYVIMEIAAQATTFNRLDTLQFDGLIFTNLDREHAELYPTMEEYFDAKSKIFEYVKSDCTMIINADDTYGQRLLKKYPKAIILDLKTIKNNAYTYSNLPGLFNAYNLVGVLLLLQKLGIKIDPNIGAIPAIPGRLQKVTLPNGAQAYIDYAHTPGSFKSVLSTVREWTKHLIVVFGAGGSKDNQKRSLMGSVTEQFADHIILADDNPRTEDPQKIIKDILSGITNKSKVTIEHDRQKSIQLAYDMSQADSIIMILGKGPDEYQIIGTKKIPFSEKGILEGLSLSNNFNL
jgi:UDP-N-acetylmuramoyl-L-alanyl-D-glutamate--2,6-diaminopimelate ligase